ncbi:MAG: hypothetical protein KGL39_29745 [Patescibacteria group bacterium]|nr:hypothetical protein [Patescibacteria group bacterium]
MPQLTFSGNEITDAERSAALSWPDTQQGGSTDGETTPAGVGIWEAGTNLFRRGQCDATTDWNGVPNGGVVTVAIDTTVAAPFSPQSIRFTLDGAAAQQGGQAETATGQAAAAGTDGVCSVYFKGVAGLSYIARNYWLNTDASATIGANTTFVATGAWQLLQPAAVAVAAGKTGDALFVQVIVNGTRAETFHLAHAMQQSGVLFVTPYVATSQGATATRNAARVQAPASLLNATQGWVAARVTVPWSAASPPGGGSGFPFILYWAQDNNNKLDISFNESTRVWQMESAVGGVFSSAVSAVQSFPAGSTLTIVGYWTSTTLGIGVNGGAFVTAARSAVQGTMPSTFDLGSAGGGADFIDGDFLWAACGTGTLSNADAAMINAWIAAPILEMFPSAAMAVAVMPFITANYIDYPLIPIIAGRR